MKGTSQSVKLIGVHIKYIIRPRSSIPPLVKTTYFEKNIVRE